MDEFIKDFIYYNKIIFHLKYTPHRIKWWLGKVFIRRFKKKTIDVIPDGSYCYKDDYVCPYFASAGMQGTGYCKFLEEGDEGDTLGLIWDQVKACGEKDYHYDE